jgi:hypothetical protein
MGQINSRYHVKVFLFCLVVVLVFNRTGRSKDLLGLIETSSSCQLAVGNSKWYSQLSFNIV